MTSRAAVFALSGLLAALSPPAPAAEALILVQRSPLAGLRHYEARGIWRDLHAGDRLEIVRERENPHDANAVRVEWRGRKLGYVPRSENGALAWAMDRGEALRARVSRVAEHRNPRRRIEFEVYIE